MNNMIVENLGLSFVLFIAYFSFLSWLLETPQTQTKNQQDFYSQVSELLTTEQSLPNVEVNKPQNQEIETIPKHENQSPVKLPKKSQPTSISLHHQLKELIENFNFRELRQLCRPLKIQQKCNGVEKTKQLILAEIKRTCKEQPEQVFAAISSKMPEKLESLEIAKIS